MGLLDVLTGRHKLAKPASDRLFAITTAYVTFELVLKAQIGNELPLEAELQRWFPLWGIPL
jgi:hypothetical protein